MSTQYGLFCVKIEDIQKKTFWHLEMASFFGDEKLKQHLAWQDIPLCQIWENYHEQCYGKWAGEKNGDKSFPSCRVFFWWV